MPLSTDGSMLAESLQLTRLRTVSAGAFFGALPQDARFYSVPTFRMRTLVKQFGRSFVQSYLPRKTTKPALKAPPTGVVFDATVVALFFLLGIGLLVV